MLARGNGSAEAASLGVNFTDRADSSDRVATGEYAGAPGYEQSHWNNVEGAAGTSVQLVDDTGLLLDGVGVTWSCGNTWRSGSAISTPDQRLLFGYLDDTANGDLLRPQIDITGVPYPQYSVILYLGSDTPNAFDYGAFFLQDSSGNDLTARVYGGEIRMFSGTYRQIPADSTDPNTAEAGGNFIVFEGLDLPHIRIGGARTASSRASIAAVQIVADLLPVIREFSAVPPVVDPGETTTLAWAVERTERLELNGQEVTGLTSIDLAVDTTSAFELVAWNEYGSTRRWVTVEVRDLRPVIELFSVQPRALDRGDQATLTWSVRDADTVLLNEVVVPAAESRLVAPETTTRYTLTATNAWGVTESELELPVVTGAGHVVISEFMADNDRFEFEGVPGTPDWIEVYNPTDVAIPLLGFGLTDRADHAGGWIFPAIELAPKAHLLVFATGRSMRDPDAPLEADFQLDREGEYLALLAPGGGVLHEFAPMYPFQREDIAYGILASGKDSARYLGEPTPGDDNNPAPAPAWPVLFEPPSTTFASGPMLVTLSSPSPGAEIRFTLDGTRPSLTHGELYAGPIEIGSSTTIRAVALADSAPASPGTAAEYIAIASDLLQFESPLPILLIDNFGAGGIPNRGFTQTMQGVDQVPRQPAGMALFDRAAGSATVSVSGLPDMTQRVGIRVRGAYSSTFPRPPYSIEAWDGEDRDVEIAPLGMPAESDWILYRPHEDIDNTLMFNTWIYALSNEMGKYAVRTRFVQGFVNTQGGAVGMDDYMGLYVLMEKVKRDPNRIDIPGLTPDGTQGGWLLALNRMDPVDLDGTPPRFFHTAGANRIQETPRDALGRGDDEPRQSNCVINFESPNGYAITDAQRDAIEGWFVPFEDALWGAQYRDPVSGYRRYLDTADFVDYFILHNLSKNGDGLLLSMWVYMAGGESKLKMGPIWDLDLLAYRGDPGSELLYHSDRIWYGRLFQDVDFYQEYVDRWQTHRRGALADANMLAIIDRQAAEITAPVAAAHGVSSWSSRIASWKAWLLARAAAIDGSMVPMPTITPAGGAVSPSTVVTLRSDRGRLCYRLDGKDPRAAGGALAPGTQSTYAGSVALTLHETSVVTARVLDGSEWSGLLSEQYWVDTVAATAGTLWIGEFLYRPAQPTATEAAAGYTDADAFEFIEIVNRSDQSVRLEGVAFTEGVLFQFADHDLLAPGARALVVRDPGAFALRHPEVPEGVVRGGYIGGTGLSNSGETITLSGPDGVLDRITYSDAAPWPAAGLGGWPLVRLNYGSGSGSNPDDWRLSSDLGGAPGVVDGLSFSEFMVAHGLAGDGAADEDDDGLDNFTEYALGTDPRVADARAGLLTLARPQMGEVGAGYLVIAYPGRTGADDAIVALEASADLENWSNAAPMLEPLEQLSLGDDRVLFRFRTLFTVEAGALPQLFFRLRVSPR